MPKNRRTRGASKPRTEVVRASELHERIILPIARLRDAEFAKAEKEYPKLLEAYEQVRNGRPEMYESKGFTGEKVPTGFYEAIGEDGRPVFRRRPKPPEAPPAYRYRNYERYGVLTQYAEQNGVLPHGKYNREIRDARVDEYTHAMRAGEWHGLLSDPITITATGDVLNGQHRLAAADRVNWSKAPNDPTFMVIWNVDPHEALYADGSNRTKRDQTTIAQKVAGIYITERKPSVDEQVKTIRASFNAALAEEVAA